MVAIYVLSNMIGVVSDIILRIYIQEPLFLLKKIHSYSPYFISK